MIILGYPIDLRYLHRQLWWQLRYMREVKPQHDGAKLTFLYFSYQPDFKFIELSLQTLAQSVPINRIQRIVIAEDQKAPFTETERLELEATLKGVKVTFKPIYDFEWGSPKSTFSELQLFREVAGECSNPSDLIVKVDSDILFIKNQAKWQVLLDAPQESFGDAHFLQYQYAQGGMYMLRKSVIERIFPEVTIDELEQIASDINSVGEDMAITEILRRRNKSFFFLRVMLFPGEYKKLRKINKRTASEFLALHCHKDKIEMKNYSWKFNLIVHSNIKR